MVVPGSIEARYQRLAGPPERRTELYVARRRLGFSIEEWLALPWWQRRVYVEGLNNEAQEQNAPDPQQPGGNGGSWADSILTGSIGDVASMGFAT